MTLFQKPACLTAFWGFNFLDGFLGLGPLELRAVVYVEGLVDPRANDCCCVRE